MKYDITKIKNLGIEKNISESEVAKLSRIPKSRLNKIYNNPNTIQINTICRLARVFETTPVKLLEYCLPNNKLVIEKETKEFWEFDYKKLHALILIHHRSISEFCKYDIHITNKIKALCRNYRGNPTLETIDYLATELGITVSNLLRKLKR